MTGRSRPWSRILFLLRWIRSSPTRRRERHTDLTEWSRVYRGVLLGLALGDAAEQRSFEPDRPLLMPISTQLAIVYCLRVIRSGQPSLPRALFAIYSRTRLAIKMVGDWLGRDWVPTYDSPDAAMSDLTRTAWLADLHDDRLRPGSGLRGRILQPLANPWIVTFLASTPLAPIEKSDQLQLRGKLSIDRNDNTTADLPVAHLVLNGVLAEDYDMNVRPYQFPGPMLRFDEVDDSAANLLRESKEFRRTYPRSSARMAAELLALAPERWWSDQSLHEAFNLRPLAERGEETQRRWMDMVEALTNPQGVQAPDLQPEVLTWPGRESRPARQERQPPAGRPDARQVPTLFAHASVIAAMAAVSMQAERQTVIQALWDKCEHSQVRGQGAVIGALLGLWAGENAFPDHWRDSLPYRTQLEQIANDHAFCVRRWGARDVAMRWPRRGWWRDYGWTPPVRRRAGTPSLARGSRRRVRARRRPPRW